MGPTTATKWAAFLEFIDRGDLKKPAHGQKFAGIPNRPLDVLHGEERPKSAVTSAPIGAVMQNEETQPKPPAAR